MTSGVAELEHSGLSALTLTPQPFLAFVASVMKPSIFPPSTSALAFASPWGPPPLTSAVSW